MIKNLHLPSSRHFLHLRFPPRLVPKIQSRDEKTTFFFSKLATRAPLKIQKNKRQHRKEGTFVFLGVQSVFLNTAGNPPKTAKIRNHFFYFFPPHLPDYSKYGQTKHIFGMAGPSSIQTNRQISKIPILTLRKPRKLRISPLLRNKICKNRDFNAATNKIHQMVPKSFL